MVANLVATVATLQGSIPISHRGECNSGTSAAQLLTLKHQYGDMHVEQQLCLSVCLSIYVCPYIYNSIYISVLLSIILSFLSSCLHFLIFLFS
jgi:hypothetical protein